jgi:RNA-directed DNA polymerase
VSQGRVNFPLWAKLRIASRDGWKCHICGLGHIVDDPWEIDHDTPISKGGKNTLKNLRLSHKKCNREKSNA